MTRSSTVLTEDIVVRPFSPGISGKYTHYKAHHTSCRYAQEDMTTMAKMVEIWGEHGLRTKVVVGIVERCKVCNPVLLVIMDDGVEVGRE